ncbi:MAG TPA: hypothetical protein PKY96_12010, partial [Flavobacteriales bacterium]|nr:hypothetical protein [Flavobacteriales bacterium]
HFQMHTQNVQRARLNANTPYNVNVWNIQGQGFFGLSPDGSLWNNGLSAFTRFHLHDGGVPQQGSYRN